MEEHLDRDPENMAAICQHVFKEASESLIREAAVLKSQRKRI
jgi:hypothetical protein